MRTLGALVVERRERYRAVAAGALGGAINACLCYFQWPVAASDYRGFRWYVIPAGALHGAVLAAVAVTAATLLRRRSAASRALTAVPLAWVAGALSFIPIYRSVFSEDWYRSVTWPFQGSALAAMLAPFQYFGVVAGLFYLYLVFVRDRLPPGHISLGGPVLAGVLGSLWWWVSAEPWYLSLLHGSIWGAIVGVAARARPASGARILEGVA
jgi:hypothetical protein